MEKLQAKCQELVAYVNDKVNVGLEHIRSADRKQVNAIINKVQYTITPYVKEALELIAKLPPEMLKTIQKTITYGFVASCAFICVVAAPLTFTTAFLASALFPQHLKTFNDFLAQQWDRLDNPADPTDHTRKIFAGGCLAAIALPTIAAAWMGQSLPQWLLGSNANKALTTEDATFEEESTDPEALASAQEQDKCEEEAKDHVTTDASIETFLFPENEKEGV